jgi:hypothetical protein
MLRHLVAWSAGRRPFDHRFDGPRVKLECYFLSGNGSVICDMQTSRRFRAPGAIRRPTSSSPKLPTPARQVLLAPVTGVIPPSSAFLELQQS